MGEKKKGLELLREPFAENQIGKLPKPTKKQTDDLKANINLGIRCKICGGWHHKDVQHLDYVGHAALTDRLLDADPSWSWEPFTLKDGLPAFDKDGGLWIRLTICGITRIGYGNAVLSNFKEAGSREKEVIGDALRNAAMRFGAALDLWHKGDLHKGENDDREGIGQGDKGSSGGKPAAQVKMERSHAAPGKSQANEFKPKKDNPGRPASAKAHGQQEESIEDFGEPPPWLNEAPDSIVDYLDSKKEKIFRQFTIEALAHYDDKESVKMHGFRWNAAVKKWTKNVSTEDDLSLLPFKWLELEP